MDTWDALLAVEAARLHHLEGRSHTEIAAELGISRFRVRRLILAAREEDWLRITVDPPPGIAPELTRELAAACRPHGVARVLVTPDGGGRPALERAAADAVERAAGDGNVLGLACGRTVNRVVSAIRRLPACEVVQLTGLTAPGEVTDSSVETVRRLTVPLPRLLGARERVVVVARPERARAVAAALRTGMVDTLVIIESAARALLEDGTGAAR
jgi:DNA-binding transcriptional regulator LsrR (DeoR family)